MSRARPPPPNLPVDPGGGEPINASGPPATRHSAFPMKAAAFAYSRPEDIEEACALLAGDEGARLIAGGQTLVPLMAMRLARPTLLVDIARIPELAFVRDLGDA